MPPLRRGRGRAMLCRMNEPFSFRVRPAGPEDAAAMAKVYVDAWQDAYPGVISLPLLAAMTAKKQVPRWQSALDGTSAKRALVAETEADGIVGMSAFGPGDDKALALNAEILDLYVAPSFYGLGIGRTLLLTAFATLVGFGLSSCLAWVPAHAQTRFFFEALGGRPVAERTGDLLGEAVPEIAYGWPTLMLAEQSPARG